MSRALTYTYNTNGFMTQQTVTEAGTLEWTHTYTPGPEDRLSTYTRADESVGGSNNITVDYVYNERGIRVSESIGSNERRFLIDAANPTGYAQVLLERNGVSPAAVQRRYALGGDVLAQNRGGSWDGLAADGHGSTRQLTRFRAD